MPRKKARKRRKWPRFFPVALAVAGGAGWWFRDDLKSCWQVARSEIDHLVRRAFQPDPGTYASLVRNLEHRRVELAQRNRQAKTPADQAAVERDARAALEDALPAMMHCWLGTPYDFNGTASRPGGGKIACGYFVATVLKDAGFDVNRNQLAQQASGNILRTFLPEKSCALTVGEDYPGFSARMKQREAGIYVVGLDTHVAFVVADGNGFRFIHATASRPRCVVDQSPAEARTLRRSKWRMLGNLTADRDLLRRWLKAEEFDVRGT